MGRTGRDRVDDSLSAIVDRCCILSVGAVDRRWQRYEVWWSYREGPVFFIFRDVGGGGAKKDRTNMVQVLERPRIGQYILTRPLQPGPAGSRQLALHDLDSSSHVIHRPALGRDRAEQRRFLSVLGGLQSRAHPHLLSIEEYGLDGRGHPYIVTPFTGDATGLVTLETLLRAKGGFFSVTEAQQAIVQVLEAIGHATGEGCRHGPLSMDEVLVDRRGRIQLEFYGLRRALHLADMSQDASEPAEVLAVLRLAYQLVTGLIPDEPLISAGRVVPGLEEGLGDWFQTGLHGPGFRSAAHALSALRDRSPLSVARLSVGRSVGLMRSLLGRWFASRA